MIEIEMEIESIRIDTRRTSQNRVIILKERESERYLYVWISASEADSIEVKRKDYLVPRPLTHDLLLTILTSFGSIVNKVVVESIEHDTFYAKLCAEDNNGIREYDCRVSDAVAVAVRAKAPIFATDTVLDKAGVILDQEENIEKPGALPKTALRSLKKQKNMTAIFSNGAQRALNRAEEIAKKAGNNYVQTIDILIALVKQNDSRAAIILARLGLKAVEYVYVPEEYDKEHGISINMKRVIHIAIEETQKRKSKKVRTEHLLLGLLKEEQGLASKILTDAAVNEEMIVEQLMNMGGQKA